MFLWCGCHCEKGSESIPSVSIDSASERGSSISESITSEGPPTVPVVGCNPCRYGIAPAVYEFEWNYTGQAIKPFPPRPCCPSYTTQKKYKLYKRPPRSSLDFVCRWSSNELSRTAIPQPPFGFTAICEDAASGDPRVLLDMEARSATAVYVILYVFYRGRTSAAEYLLVDDNGNAIFTRGEGVECLKPLRFRGIWALQGRPAIWLGSGSTNGVAFGSPCDQVNFSMIDSGLPEYVTCTPVPA
jgi:hypothetical protein